MFTYIYMQFMIWLICFNRLQTGEHYQYSVHWHCGDPLVCPEILLPISEQPKFTKVVRSEWKWEARGGRTSGEAGQQEYRICLHKLRDITGGTCFLFCTTNTVHWNHTIIYDDNFVNLRRLKHSMISSLVDTHDTARHESVTSGRLE
jgi:hypothetical protein